MSERTSERSGRREQSEQSGANERGSSASERANGRASGPVLQSVFLAVLDHSARERELKKRRKKSQKKEMEQVPCTNGQKWGGGGEREH